jgi:hypothetical protein
LVTAVHQHQAWFMVWDFSFHAVNNTNVINAAADILEDFTDINAALAITLERERAWEESTGFALGLDATARDGLACVLCEVWFIVKCVEMTGTTIHKELDDALCFWGKVRRSHGERVYGWLGIAIVGEDARKRHSAKTAPGLHQEVSTGDEWF